MTLKLFRDKLIKDKNGKIVLFQFPNPPIIGWIICAVLSNLSFSPKIINGLMFTAAAFLFCWAYLEITAGSNYLRRILGVAVMIYLLISKF